MGNKVNLEHISVLLITKDPPERPNLVPLKESGLAPEQIKVTTFTKNLLHIKMFVKGITDVNFE